MDIEYLFPTDGKLLHLLRFHKIYASIIFSYYCLYRRITTIQSNTLPPTIKIDISKTYSSFTKYKQSINLF